MREYGQIQCSFWTHPDVQSLSDDSKLLAAYLLTGPHSNGLGCYRLPDGYIQADFGWRSERVSKGFMELLRMGFCKRCESTDFVIIWKFLHWNPISNPKVAQARFKEFEAVSKKSNIYKDLCYSVLKYGNHLPKPFETLCETISKGYAIQEPTLPEPEQTRISMSGSADETAKEQADPQATTPPPNGKANAKQQAIEVLEFLNEKTGRRYQAVDANLKLISARLKEGATTAQCRQVIAKKFREWNTDPKMAEYLRPATLFNATKFAQYVGELIPPQESNTRQGDH